MDARSRLRLFTIVFALGLLIEGEIAAAQTIRFGFTSLPEDLRITESGEPAAVVLREAVGGTLLRMVREKQSGVPRLDLADSLSIRSRGREIVVSLKKGAVFSNGRPVTEEDVAYSLQFCKKLGWLDGIGEFSVRSEYKGGQEDVYIYFTTVDPPTPNSAFRAIASCPVYEARSAKLFGKSFGEGTNLVSAGPFVLSSFSKGRSYHLIRSPYSKRGTEGPQEIVLISSTDASKGLGSLRSGDIDLLFPGKEDGETIQKAQGDESLVVSQCGINTLVYRRSLDVPCDDGSIRVAEVHYSR